MVLEEELLEAPEMEMEISTLKTWKLFCLEAVETSALPLDGSQSSTVEEEAVEVQYRYMDPNLFSSLEH